MTPNGAEPIDSILWDDGFYFQKGEDEPALEITIDAHFTPVARRSSNAGIDSDIPETVKENLGAYAEEWARERKAAEKLEHPAKSDNDFVILDKNKPGKVKASSNHAGSSKPSRGIRSLHRKFSDLQLGTRKDRKKTDGDKEEKVGIEKPTGSASGPEFAPGSWGARVREAHLQREAEKSRDPANPGAVPEPGVGASSPGFQPGSWGARVREAHLQREAEKSRDPANPGAVPEPGVGASSPGLQPGSWGPRARDAHLRNQREAEKSGEPANPGSAPGPGAGAPISEINPDPWDVRAKIASSQRDWEKYRMFTNPGTHPKPGVGMPRSGFPDQMLFSPPNIFISFFFLEAFLPMSKGPPLPEFQKLSVPPFERIFEEDRREDEVLDEVNAHFEKFSRLSRNEVSLKYLLEMHNKVVDLGDRDWTLRQYMDRTAAHTNARIYTHRCTVIVSRKIERKRNWSWS